VSYREILESELVNFQIAMPAQQKTVLAAYCDEVTRWNRTINLTALSGVALVRRLVVEPVWIAHQLAMKGGLIDIGSGNGAPAIPFHVTRSFESCCLIEARARRAAFLRHLAATMGLKNVAVYRARFEDIGPTLLSPDWVSLQAVALSRDLIDSIRKIARSTTTIVWVTSPSAQSRLKPFRTLRVPVTGTEVLLYRLDLS